MARLKDLPIGYLIHALKTNPASQSFPWSIGRTDTTRQEILDELNRRGEPFALADTQAELRAAHEYEMCKAWNPWETQPAEPFSPAGEEQNEITVLIFTSHVPSHPQTWLIEKAYDSIRVQLPTARIVILADGCNGPEPEAYIQFKNAIINKGWDVISFEGKHHQSLMLKHVLTTPNLLTTSLVFVTEHDWTVQPLYIDWRGIVETLTTSPSEMGLIQIRQNRISTAEKETCYFKEAIDINGIKLLPTIGFQGPSHVARVDWYQRQVCNLCTPNFLERDELRAAMINSGGINEMAAYIPMGPVGRLSHRNGAWAVNP